MRKIKEAIKRTLKEDYKFIIFIIILYIILQYPLNYYITVGGGISDISSRIKVEDAYNSEGSLNISYVTQLPGTILTYGLSYIIPTWERESVNLYKYNEEESLDDIEFRSNLDLTTANGTATYWAYTLANKKIDLTSQKLYVITTFSEYETPLKVKDQILSIDDNSFSTINEYKEYLQTKNINTPVTVKVIRNNKEQDLEAKLHEIDGKLYLGVGLQYVKEYNTDPEVKIKFKSDESGPSGGLITTLEIYNQLTEKDITKGKKIAGTGTIEEDGTIGKIGGIKHKILGASKEKADIFLVPSANYKTAEKYKEERNLDIILIEVKTVEDAIKKLENLK
ncbi:MAG: PDZ domain-containing protein [Bacilli bacterium]|nr:PDZ domain-containing protein [Bacilli bacterium]